MNQQIQVYIFARAVLALAKLSIQEGGAVPAQLREPVANNSWPVFAAVSWGAVMWLYGEHEDNLMSSLRSSMQYMYVHYLDRSNRIARDANFS